MHLMLLDIRALDNDKRRKKTTKKVESYSMARKRNAMTTFLKATLVEK